MNALINSLLRLDSAFKEIFFAREFQALAGKRYRNLWMLGGIALLTFAALGFAFGGLSKLERRMNDPFTNWVNLEVGSERIAQTVPFVQEKFMQGAAREYFQLNTISPYSKFVFQVYHRDFDPFRDDAGQKLFSKWGRDIEYGDPLLGKIFDPNGDNVIVLPPKGQRIGDALAETPEGIIVKAEMLFDLGFATRDTLSALGFQMPDTLPDLFISVGVSKPKLTHIPVLAVVKELPNKANFLCSTRLYNIIAAGGERRETCGEHFVPGASLDGRENTFSFWAREGLGEVLQTQASAFFVGRKPEVDTRFLAEINGQRYEQHLLSFLPTARPDSIAARNFVAKIRADGLLLHHKLNCSENDCNENLDPNYVACHFERLDHIEAFRDTLKLRFDLSISMDQIESKKNFALVARLTQMACFVLLFFGLLSVVLFVKNLLESHLMEIRPHIGTFAAFGLSERLIKGIYRKITLAFMALSTGSALLLAGAFDVLCRQRWGIETPFDVWNFWILGAVVGLFAFCYCIAGSTIGRLLNNTPGNLIYER